MQSEQRYGALALAPLVDVVDAEAVDLGPEMVEGVDAPPPASASRSPPASSRRVPAGTLGSRRSPSRRPRPRPASAWRPGARAGRLRVACGTLTSKGSTLISRCTSFAPLALRVTVWWEYATSGSGGAFIFRTRLRTFLPSRESRSRALPPLAEALRVSGATPAGTGRGWSRSGARNAGSGGPGGRSRKTARPPLTERSVSSQQPSCPLDPLPDDVLVGGEARRTTGTGARSGAAIGGAALAILSGRAPRRGCPSRSLRPAAGRAGRGRSARERAPSDRGRRSRNARAAGARRGRSREIARTALRPGPRNAPLRGRASRSARRWGRGR